MIQRRIRFVNKSIIILVLLICQTFNITASHIYGTPEMKDQIAPSFPTVNSLEDRIVGLSRLWSEIKYNFVNIDRLDFNIDSLYEATLPKVISASNDVEYYDILQRFCASFNDGHTEIIATTYGWNDIFDYIPCNISEFGSKFYFTSVRKNSGIDPVLLHAEIIEVEGQPTLQYIEQKLFPSISASTYSHRLMQGVAKLCGGVKFSHFNGKARKQNGEVVDFSIIRDGETTRTENDEYFGNLPDFHNRMIDLEWRGDIALLQVNTFSSEEIQPILDSLATRINDKAKGLIIDLRYNGGGKSTIARHLQMYLTKADSIMWFGSQTRINNGYGRSQGNYREEYANFYLNKAYETTPASSRKKANYVKSFNMPTVILIGPYSFSACEDLLINIYEMPGRPILIGQQTGGSTGAPLMIPLPNNAWARVCSIRMIYPYSGKPFVNMGIQPDIMVKHTLENYIHGIDEDINKAMEYLSPQIK